MSIFDIENETKNEYIAIEDYLFSADFRNFRKKQHDREETQKLADSQNYIFHKIIFDKNGGVRIIPRYRNNSQQIYKEIYGDNDKENLKYKIIKKGKVIDKIFTKKELFERYNYHGEDIDNFLNSFKIDYSNCKSFNEIQELNKDSECFVIACEYNLDEFVKDLVIKKFHTYLIEDYDIEYCKMKIEENILNEFKENVSFYKNMWLNSNDLLEFYKKGVFVFSKKEICSIKKYIRKELQRVISYIETKNKGIQK